MEPQKASSNRWSSTPPTPANRLWCIQSLQFPFNNHIYGIQITERKISVHTCISERCVNTSWKKWKDFMRQCGSFSTVIDGILTKIFFSCLYKNDYQLICHCMIIYKIQTPISVALKIPYWSGYSSYYLCQATVKCPIYLELAVHLKCNTKVHNPYCYLYGSNFFVQLQELYILVKVYSY